MKQDEFTWISDEIADGQIVEGWVGERYTDIHVLRRLKPDALWVRRPPNSSWVKVPGMGGVNA
jgi:hypothetical protein